MKFSPPSSTLTDYILPGQEQFWQSFDISQPAWYWSTFLMWSPRHKSSHASPTKRTFPVSGFFFLEVLTFSEAWGWEVRDAQDEGLKNGICEACFAIQMSGKRRNPGGLVQRCTLMEFETQIKKGYPKLNLVVFFHFLFFFFSVFEFFCAYLFDVRACSFLSDRRSTRAEMRGG